jgi:hypothetical protein
MGCPILPEGGLMILAFIVTGLRWLIPIILATQKAEVTGIEIWSQPRQIVMRLYLKNTQHKKIVGGLLECLLSKHAALSSNPSAEKKKSLSTHVF